ncbi:MAG TPA: hypothetical protein VFY01_05310 [Rheinheimera sp.]|nr:hypothetical protein [Rheinheimera sp.]
MEICQRNLLTGQVDYHNEYRFKAKPLNNFAFKKVFNQREKHKAVMAPLQQAMYRFSITADSIIAHKTVWQFGGFPLQPLEGYNGANFVRTLPQEPIT